MNRLAFIEILCAGVLWGIIGLFVRRLNAMGIPPAAQIACRAAFSALIMFAFLAVKKRGGFKIRIKDVWMFVGTGILSFTLFNRCYIGAIERVSLSLAAVLLYTAPVFVMLMSRIFFKEPITRRKVLALVLAFSGCALSAWAPGSSRVDPQGIVLGLLSGFLYALYSIFGRVALGRYAPSTVTAYTFLFATAASAPFSGSTFLMIAKDPALLGFIALFAVTSGLLPYILYTGGLSKISPDKASILASTEPVAATVVGVLCFNEPLTLASSCGIALVIAAIVLLNTRAKTLPKNS